MLRSGQNKGAAAVSFWLTTIALLFLNFSPVFAHDGIHEQILAVTEEIKKDPHNAALYLKRAELYRIHEEWKNADKDYNKAEKLEPNLTAVNLGRGKLQFAKGNFSKAKNYLKKYLKLEPNSFDGFVTFARLSVKLKDTKSSVDYFTKAIALSPGDSAELYLERAETLESAGEIDEALRGLDEGLEKFGQLVTLQSAAIELELKKKRYDAALERLDKITATMTRKESFLLRRGEILLEAGKPCDAHATFLDAQKGFESLSSFRKNVRAIKAQIEKLEKYLVQVSAKACE